MLPWMSPTYSRPNMFPSMNVQASHTSSLVDRADDTPTRNMSSSRHLDMKDSPRVSRSASDVISGHMYTQPRYPIVDRGAYRHITPSTSQMPSEIYKQYFHHQQQWMNAPRTQAITQAQNTRVKLEDSLNVLNMGDPPFPKYVKTSHLNSTVSSCIRQEPHGLPSRDSVLSVAAPSVVQYRVPSAASSRSPSVLRQCPTTPPSAAQEEPGLPPLDLSINRKRSNDMPITHPSDEPLDLSKKKRDADDDDDVILVEIHEPCGHKTARHEVLSQYGTSIARNIPLTSLADRPHRSYHAVPNVNTCLPSTSKMSSAEISEIAWKADQKFGNPGNSELKSGQSTQYTRDGSAYQLSRTDKYNSDGGHSNIDAVTGRTHTSSYPLGTTDHSLHNLPHKSEITPFRSESQSSTLSQPVRNLQEQIREEQQCFKAHEKAMEEKGEIHRKHFQMVSQIQRHDSMLYHGSREHNHQFHRMDYHNKLLGMSDTYKTEMSLTDDLKPASYKYLDQRNIANKERVGNVRTRTADHVMHEKLQSEEYKPIQHSSTYKNMTIKPKSYGQMKDSSLGRTHNHEMLNSQHPLYHGRTNGPIRHMSDYCPTPLHTNNVCKAQVNPDVQVLRPRQINTALNSMKEHYTTSDVAADVTQVKYVADNRASQSLQHGRQECQKDELDITVKSPSPVVTVNWYEKVEAYKESRSRVVDSHIPFPKHGDGKHTTLPVSEKSQLATNQFDATDKFKASTPQTPQSSAVLTGDTVMPALRSSTENRCTKNMTSELCDDIKSPPMVAKNESKFVESKPNKLIPVANVHPMVHPKKSGPPVEGPNQSGALEEHLDCQVVETPKSGTSVSSPNTCVMEVFKQTLDEVPQKIHITPNPLYSNHQGEFVRFINRADSNAHLDQTQKLKKSEVKTTPPGLTEMAGSRQNINNSAYQTPDTSESANLAGKDLENSLQKVCRNLSLHFTTPKGRHKLLAKHSSSVPMDSPLSSATELVSFHPPVQNPNRPKPKRKRPSKTNEESSTDGVKKFKLMKKSAKLKEGRPITKQETMLQSPKRKKGSVSSSSTEDTKPKIKSKTYYTRNKPKKTGARISGRSSSYDKNAAYDAELQKEEERKKMRRVRRKTSTLIPDLSQRTSSTEDNLGLTDPDAAPTDESQDQTQSEKGDNPSFGISVPVAEERSDEPTTAHTCCSVKPVKTKRKYTRRDPSKNPKVPKKMIKKESGPAQRIVKKLQKESVGDPSEHPESEIVVNKPHKRPYHRKKPLLKKSSSLSKANSDIPMQQKVKRVYRKRKDQAKLDAVGSGERLEVIPDIDSEEQYLPLLPTPSKPKGKRYPMQRVRRRRKEPRAELSCEAPLDKKRLFICREIGETTLHKAARKGYVEAALQCLDCRELDVNVRDNAGYTPLHESCVSGNLTIARALIDRGADPNAKALGGTRPIHDAVDNNHLELVRLLLSHGADPTIANYAGKIPLKMARSTAMKNFLNDYFSDVRDEPAEIEIPAFLGKQGCELGFDILEGAPTDVDTDAESGVLFDMSSEPKPPTLCLQLDRHNGYMNYHLLEDVADSLGVHNPDDFVLLNGDLQFGKLPKSEVLAQLRMQPLDHVTYDVIKHVENHAGESVSFVEIDDVLCQLLEVTRERIRNKDFALGQWFLGPLGKSSTHRLGADLVTAQAPATDSEKCRPDGKVVPTTETFPVKVMGKKHHVAMMVAAEPERYESNAQSDQRLIYKVATEEVRRNQGLLESCSNKDKDPHTNEHTQSRVAERLFTLRKCKSCTSLKALLPPRKYESPDLIRFNSNPDVRTTVRTGSGLKQTEDNSTFHTSRSTTYQCDDASGIIASNCWQPVETSQASHRLLDTNLLALDSSKFLKNQPYPGTIVDTAEILTTFTAVRQSTNTSELDNLSVPFSADGNVKRPVLNCRTEVLTDPVPVAESSGRRETARGLSLVSSVAPSDPALPVLEEHSKATRPSVGETASAEEDREMPELTMCAYLS